MCFEHAQRDGFFTGQKTDFEIVQFEPEHFATGVVSVFRKMSG